ncbi:MAG: hypothetical protein GY787_32470 [Alteromonadales bacterium]|nr:hypothetical protein [Alteromonadales bacterium]
MNKHILFAIDHQINPSKYTQKQLQENQESAHGSYGYAFSESFEAACLVNYASEAAEAGNADDLECWLDRYFKHTSENRQDYIDAINKDNKQ